jgi:hypothetical protein
MPLAPGKDFKKDVQGEGLTTLASSKSCDIKGGLRKIYKAPPGNFSGHQSCFVARTIKQDRRRMLSSRPWKINDLRS